MADSSQVFDVVVIGAGPAGYIAAIRAAQLGFTVACIDEWKNPQGKPSLGGTCLNVGCIPSKALLESSENYERVLHKFAAQGIKTKGVELDLPTMLGRKDKIVGELTNGIAYLFKKNKVTSIHGHGRFAGPAQGGMHSLEVSDGTTKQTVSAKHVIIATGSVPRAFPHMPFDNEVILDNAGALALSAVPKRLGVIGSGVIGLEMGSVWRRLGAQVAILEAMDAFLPAADEQVAKEALKIFTKSQGLDIRLGAKITSIKREKNLAKVVFEEAGTTQEMECDKLVVAIGRAPNTSDLNLQMAGVKTDARGFIEVDDDCNTGVEGVYAVGDVVRGPMLAHKGMEEGVAVAERLAGQRPHVNLDHVPWVIYTSPEIAWVGQTEQALRSAKREIRTGSFPFSANGRAKGLGETAGFIKMIADAQTDAILGVHVIGPFASELIAEATVAIEFGASSEDIARIVHAHPSLSEGMHEAALAVDKRTLHF
jgi:dihydrolipoamide dehydrogenase